MQTNSPRSGRLIIVSNRLPITVQDNDGQINYIPSTGGLATGLGSLNDGLLSHWVGWPGKVQRQNQNAVEQHLRHSCQYESVFLSDRLVDKFYDGFSNRTIWPLFHSFQSYAKYSASEWEGYQEANRLFMQTLDGVIQPGDKIWIHDYQLMLLPEMIRARHPNVSVGFFLHIPFPSFEVLRLLPQHKEILQGLLACDLIGFHTHEYARAFLNSVHRSLGVEDRLGQVILDSHVVNTVVHPMGIDFEKFSNASEKLTDQSAELVLQEALGTSQLIFSVSRLDYTKGILQTIESYELLLEKKQELRSKITFVLVVVPSREKVDRYARLKRKIDEAVGRINAKFGQVGWTPIRYIYRSLSFDELVVLYKHADVGLVTPLRDGLNLVAKEYVASRNCENGVLILSEMAGAAKELLEAIIVNPNSREEMASAIYKALTMTPAEQTARMRALRERLLESPINNWGEDFVTRLDACAAEREKFERDAWGTERSENLVTRALNSSRRLLVLDYDGTLMPLMNDPNKVQPDEKLLQLLNRLGKEANDEVILLSGRSRADLGKWFADCPITLVAEHGAWLRLANSKVWQNVTGASSLIWKSEVKAVLQKFVENIPGSSIEEKEFSLVWHYRRSEAESADVAAKDLAFYLLTVIGEYPVRIVPGNRSIEIRCIGVGKGAFAKKELDFSKFDFVLAAGDDVTDEDLFKALPKTAYSVKIGAGHSTARIRLRDHLELRRLLEEMIQVKTETEMSQVNALLQIPGNRTLLKAP